MLLLLLTFPDVIFTGTTLVNSAGYFAGLYGTPMKSLYPERSGRSYHHGFNDSGGAVWQADPMRQYMGHLIFSGESPYWNPYSATGSLGPETLIDQKFSPITLTAAALGGDQRAADAALLLFFALSLYFLYVIVAIDLGLAEAAAVAAGLVFLLGGFNVANLGSNVVHAYVLFPLLLAALMALVRNPSPARFLPAVAANALILATTFLPIACLTFASVYALAIGYAMSGPQRFARAPLLTGLLCTSFLVALLIAAPLYFPIVESFSVVDSLEMYSNRQFFPVSPLNLIGMISPKHWWESYTAIDPELLADPQALGNGAFHLGITPIMLAALGITSAAWRRSAVFTIAVLLFLLAVGRIFDVSPIASIIDQINGVRNLGCQYWWVMVAIAFPFLVAFGLDALGEADRRLLVLLPVYVLIAASLIAAYRLCGWREGRYLVQAWYVAVALLITVTAPYLIWRARRARAQAGIWKAALLALIFAELTFYMNHLRPLRNDSAQVPPAMLEMLKQNIGDYRLANFGPAGIPPEWGSAYGIPEVGSMNMSILPWYKNLFEKAFALRPDRTWGNFASLYFPANPAVINDPLIDVMAVKYLFIPAGWKQYHDMLLSRGYSPVYGDRYGTIYLNSDACPRLHIATTWFRYAGIPDNLPGPPCATAFTDDPALIAAARALGISEGTAAKPAGASPGRPIRAIQHANAVVEFKVFLAAPAIIVVSDAWHPNWRTTVNGKAVHTGLINGSFRGLALPAGEHLVEMRYRPRSLVPAIAVSLSTLLLTGFLLPRIPARHRRPLPIPDRAASWLAAAPGR